MAQHRALTPRSRKVRIVTAGLLAGSGLLMVLPTATASADQTPGEATGNRPEFRNGNPAPLVRAAQEIGDAAFDPGNGPINSALNDSFIGSAYHQAFGKAGEKDDEGEYLPGPDGEGTNGLIQGPLNTPPFGGIYSAISAQGVLPKECNLKRDDNGNPTFPGPCA